MAGRQGRLDECFKQGAAAREQHRKLADNPYDIHTDEHREWGAGWSATFDLDEDRDAASMRIDAGETDAAQPADGTAEDEPRAPRRR